MLEFVLWFVMPLALIIVLTVNILSLGFRHGYLRKKLANRLNASEMEQIDKTDMDFWSFLK